MSFTTRSAKLGLGALLYLSQSASAQLVITEVCDGTLSGGQPKFVQLTNVGPNTIADASIYSFGNMNNGNTTLGGSSSTQLLAVPVAPGASYVLAYESATNTTCDPTLTCFEFVYGAAPTQYLGGGFVNGDDALLLFLGNATGDGSDAILSDVYGVIGTDGSGESWETTDGFAYRCTAVASGLSTFLECQWSISGANGLEDPGGDDAVELLLLQNNTSPFDATTDCPQGGPTTPGLWDCPAPVFCQPSTSSFGCQATLGLIPQVNMPTWKGNDYDVLATGLNDNTNGLFFVSFSGANTAPLAGGMLCLRPPLGRTAVQNSGDNGIGGTSPCAGDMFLTINQTGAPWSGFAGPGDYMWIQAWYRDANSAMALSDALMVQFQ